MPKLISRALALLIAATGLAGLASPADAIVDRDCGDFATQAAAQTFMLASGAGDPHGLDGSDNDGVACESNPCPCGTTSPPPPPPSTGGNTGGGSSSQPAVARETGNVVSVIDGDTLKVRLRSGATVSVRMLGIDTPERGTCGAGDATDNLARMAPVRSTVHLVSDPSQAVRDRYGRLLRYVARQGGYRDLSYRQMYDGFSKPYVFGGDPVARHQEYVRGSSAARHADRGLWDGCW